MRLAGLHLMPSLDLAGTRRRSALAEVGADGRLQAISLVGPDEAVVAALPAAPALIVTDAPLVVPRETGRRDVEAVLAWCDVPAFPVSAARMRQVFGGARGERLAPLLRAGGREVAETLPDLVLRQIAWESGPGVPDETDLAAYRAAWLGVRAPAYRPRGPGRAKPAGIAPAHALLAGVLDLDGWAPHAAPDDWEALDDAACLDALACAYVALRAHRDPGAVMRLGTGARGEMLLPSGPGLRARVAVNLERMRAEGAVSI